MKTLKIITSKGYKAVVKKSPRSVAVFIHAPDKPWNECGVERPIASYGYARTIGRAFRNLARRLGTFKYGRANQ